jgi:hypothetical protein
MERNASRPSGALPKTPLEVSNGGAPQLLCLRKYPIVDSSKKNASTFIAHILKNL